MNTPGLSLFQGAESLKVNSTLERQEEEEELEDQRRRKEELGQMLQNAFDDLDEDEGNVDSTTNFQSDLQDEDDPTQHQNHLQNGQHIQLPLPSHPYGHHNGFAVDTLPTAAADHTACGAEIHNLKMMLESRNRELEHSQSILKDEYKARNELEKKLTITEAELDRALSTKSNTHELLVESKEKCSNLENAIEKFKAEKKYIEGENSTLVGKLETAQMLLSDVQRKYDMVERDRSKNSERGFEAKLKHMEDIHRAEMEILRQQMEQSNNKLDKKCSELENMSSRYQALQQNHEIMLCDKAGKINDLSQALNEAQRRCEELLSRPDYFQENVRLQKLVASLQEQIQGMEKSINSLTERLQVTTAELDVMDSVLHQHNMEDTPRRLSQTQGRVVGSTPLNPLDRMGNLKDELYRALANVKSKRDEVKRLQQIVEEKQNEIRSLKQEENKSLVQITTLKEENIRMENKLKVLEEEYELLKTTHEPQNRSQNDNHLKSVKEELQNVREEHKLLKEKHTTLDQQKQQQDFEQRKLDSQLKNLEIDLEELKQEHESLKLNYEQIHKENVSLKQRQTSDSLRLDLEKHKFLLKDSQAECDRLKNLYVEISNAKEALSFEMEKLLKSDHAKDLQVAKEKIANIQRSLQLTEVKNSELSKILEAEKLCHEREVAGLREKLEKEKLETTKAAKEAANECAKCMDYVAQLTKFEIQNLKLTNINDVSKKEMDELKQELKTSNDHIAELNSQLKLSGQQEQLIKELKTKAVQFEEYIKTHSSASELSNTSSRNSKQLSDKSVSTSPELEKTEIRKIEARIRDEMAKIFALELKKFQNKIQQTQEQSVCLQNEYQHINNQLHQRQNEVELLKQAILAEREKMEEILKEKDVAQREAIQKQNIVLQRTRDELEVKSQKVKELTNELNERQQQIEAERQSMKAVMKQWEEQRKSLDTVDIEWKQKIVDLQKAHEMSITSWQTKYNSAKRTAANYKRYSEDKEAHMLKEYDRLKFEYDASLAKIELRFKENYEKKNKELLQNLDKQRVLNGNKTKTNENNSNKENVASNS